MEAWRAGSEFGVRSLGFGVWGSEFGVRSLGFGVPSDFVFYLLPSARKMLQQVVFSVSLDQVFESFNCGPNSPASPAVCNPLGPIPFAHNCYTWDDVGAMQDGCLNGLKVMMFGQDCPRRFKHQGESVVSVAFRESAIDGDRFAASFDR